MGFAGFTALVVGIILVVLSANGRLQNVIAAAFGQQSPSATPLGSSSGSGSNPITQGGPLWQWFVNQLGSGYNPGASGEGGSGGDGGYYGGDGGGGGSSGAGGTGPGS